MMAHDCDIRPIRPADLDRVGGACWESRDVQRRLIDTQGILGMAAWEGETCVGLLHAYHVALPAWDDSLFPGYGRANLLSWPLGLPLLAARDKGLHVDGPVWGHACFHVGFTSPETHRPDRSYFGRGIGTALCEASVAWAREAGYAAVLAHGGTKAAPEYNVWMGCLPWTTYDRLGFECVAMEEDGLRLPWWADGKASPEVMRQVQEHLDAGGQPGPLCARAMILRL